MAIDIEGIKKNIVDRLYWDNRVDASKVKVEVLDGAVRLSGTVPTLSARQAAEEDARAVPGVTSVDNQLTVGYPETALSSDEEIKSRIERVLEWSADIDSSNMRVYVEDGLVTLEGSVPSYWQKVRVEDLALSIIGVLGINNSLAVVPSEKVDDRQIADSIISALKENTDIDINTIDLEVANGVVTLSGTVPHWTAYRAAEDIAQRTTGVTDVFNNLDVEQAYVPYV